MKTISRTTQKRNGRNYETTNITTDPALVYDALTHELISKKINACRWIRSIKRRQNYDGAQTITVTYDNDTRSIYIITDHS